MNRIDRLMAILTLLQSRRHTTAEQISEKFGMSLRTVYRDISALGEIGIPLSHETGKGYFVMPGYFLPPVSFSAEEANALVFMESLADTFTDASVRKHYRAALQKIKAVLKDPQKERAEQLQSNVRVYVPPEQPPDSAYLAVIQQAIAGKTMLDMGYKNNSGERSQRRVEPIGLTYYSMSWHMIAWCHRRSSYRDFKVARISGLRDTALPFSIQPHIDINEYIRSLETSM